MQSHATHYKKPLRYSNYGGYAFNKGRNLYWWSELSRHLIGLRFHPSYAEIGESRFRWGLPGWCYDLYTFWHRGRYGWAPRDTWSLDYYMNKVLAGALERLAQDSHGVPAGFPDREHTPDIHAVGSTDGDVDARFALWQAKLLEWAKAFSEDPQDVDIYDTPVYTQHRAEETRRRDALHKALREIEPWWEALWD